MKSFKLFTSNLCKFTQSKFRNFTKTLSVILLIFSSVLLTACGGGGSSTPAANTPTYTVGGTITGLVGTIIMQDNGSYPTTFTANGVYSLTAQIRPAQPTTTTSSPANSSTPTSASTTTAPDTST